MTDQTRRVLTVRGKELEFPRLTPDLTRKLLDDATKHLEGQRLNPIEAILPQLEKLDKHPEIKREYMAQSIELMRLGKHDVIPRSQVGSWIDSYAGLTWFLAWLIRLTIPDFTDEESRQLMVDSSKDKLQKLCDDVNAEWVAEKEKQLATVNGTATENKPAEAATPA